MRIERYLQINVALLVGFGAILLGMGQQSFQLPSIALVAAIISVVFTDILGWIRLNRFVANLAAVAAVALSVSDLLTIYGENHLAAIANLLIYLQIVLLFQAKNIRLYWQLMMLSLLQVVVGAALNAGLLFGVLMMAYLAAALSGLTLLFLYRETERYEELSDASLTPSQVHREHRSWLGTPRLQRFGGEHGQDLPIRALGWRHMRRTLWLAIGSAFLAGFLFLVMPRSGGASWNVRSLVTSVVGFSERVKLGALGEVSEDPREVMQVKFFPEGSSESARVGDQIYLRGAILIEYEHGEWQNNTSSGVNLLSATRPTGRAMTKQQIRLEPLNEDVLFAVYPIFPTGLERPLEFDAQHEQILCPDGEFGKQVNYSLLTSGIQANQQVPLIPIQRQEMPDRDRLEELQQLPGTLEAVDPLPGLKAAAAQVLAETQLEPDDRTGRARALERYLLSDRFSYSLRPQQRGPGDPVEDFVTANPRGHCEYFATALTLMLRSQGIPARIVVGFKSNEWNALGGAYRVRQLHAHTWVEAFLEPQQADQTEPGYDTAASGYWLRLDPTPGSAESSFINSRIANATADIADYLENIWRQYIVGLTAERQRTSIYKPLTDKLQEYFAQLTQTGFWLTLALWTGNLRNWLSTLSGSRAILLSVSGSIAAFLVLRILWRRLSSLIRLRLDRRGQNAPGNSVVPASDVGFYRRLETLLANHGLIRPASQTQQEFAAGAVAALDPYAMRLGPLMAPVVQAFYRVRFGRHALDTATTAAVEHALDRLEKEIDGGPEVWLNDGQTEPATLT